MLKMRLYRHLCLLPRYMCNGYQSSQQCFHSATSQLFRIESSMKQTANLNKYQAFEMIYKLTDHERDSLRQALVQYDSEQVKNKLEGELAANKWRARFGKHSDRAMLGGVDPTGSYCAMPDDWLNKKLVEEALPPSRDDLFRIMIVQSVPFIGFGFLDNFFMIIAGDYIEHSIGMYMCISTMAAAGLGNTISDVLGLGLAHYVEQLCEFLGLRPPKLSPAQLEMNTCRRVASYGRALGITIGCLLGMFPLWFINKKPTKKVDDEEKIVEKSPI